MVVVIHFWNVIFSVRFIQNWNLLVIHFWKDTIQHNIHSKLDCTGHPFMEGFFKCRLIQNWSSTFRKLFFPCQTLPKLDCTGHPYLEGYF